MRIEGEPIDSGRDKLGSVIGNNCKTGVNVSVMPGIRIGPNSIVSSHVCLTADLERDSIIVVESAHKTITNKFKIS